MVWTLNIGLGAPVYRERKLEFDKRLKGALSWVADHFATAYFEWQHHDEPVLIIQGTLRAEGPGWGESADELFTKLADAADQDCVGVMWNARGKPEGALFGPFAREWGPFDESKFHQPTRKVFH